jgi:S-adenosylmethionine hydrolase
MAIVTFLSDFGESDHYVAAVKAKILSINSSLSILDISHQIGRCDLAHGAFVLRSVYRDFPRGTVHLVAVNSVGSRDDNFIALELNGHFFVGTDNGIFGLISEQEAGLVVNLNVLKPVHTTFPARNILAVAAAKIASGRALTDLGPRLETYKRMKLGQPKANQKLISGHVIRVDHFGNLITNIDKRTFEILSKDKKFTISFARERLNRIHEFMHQVDPGDVFVIFNDLDLLEIGVNMGSAKNLLGMKYDSPVKINFEES